MESPAIHFAATAAGAVAWQEHGRADAPPLIFVPPLAQHMELLWERPAWWRPIDRIGRRNRFVHFDKLGTGLSDPIDEAQGLEARVEQIVAVMDAAGIERAAVMGLSEGGMAAMACAAWHPDRVAALLVVASSAGAAIRPDPERYGRQPPLDEQARFWARFVAGWGNEASVTLDTFMPSARHDEAMRRWMPRYERAAASPALIGRWVEGALSLSVDELLGDIDVPTMVLHLSGDRVIPVAHGRYLADRIPGARFAAFDGDDHFVWVSADVDDYVDCVQDFLTEHGAALRRDAVRSVSRIDRHWDPYATLTPAERRCVRLAQRAMSNQAIARSLGLSIRTVENHLSHAFTKLGVSGRVELALLGEQ